MYNSPFYNETTKRCIVAFGTIFNDIYITREDSNQREQNRIKVPLSYMPKRRFHRILNEPSKADSKDENGNSNTRVQTTLPRMSFFLSNIDRNTSKQTNQIQDIVYENGTTIKRIRNRVPYILTFELGIFTKHQEDGYKIVEQIIPFFAPSLGVTVKTNRSMVETIKDDFVLNIVDISVDQNEEGSLIDEQLQVYSWTITFSADVYFYGPTITASGIIKQTNTSLWDFNSGQGLSKVTVEVNPSSALGASFGFSTGVQLIIDDYNFNTTGLGCSC